MTSSFAPTRSQASPRRERNAVFTVAASRPSEAIELAPLALGRAAGATLAGEHRRHALDDRRRRAVIDEAPRRHRRPDTLVDDRHDLEEPLALDECLDAVADPDRRRGFGC